MVRIKCKFPTAKFNNHKQECINFENCQKLLNIMNSDFPLYFQSIHSFVCFSIAKANSLKWIRLISSFISVIYKLWWKICYSHFSFDTHNTLCYWNNRIAQAHIKRKQLLYKFRCLSISTLSDAIQKNDPLSVCR